MIVVKVYGPGGWVFLVTANNEEEVYNMVEKKLMDETYYTEDDLAGEIQFDDHVYVKYEDTEIPKPTLITLCY